MAIVLKQRRNLYAIVFDHVNSLWPSDIFCHHGYLSSMLKAIAWYLRALPMSMMAYCELDSWKLNSVTFQLKYFFIQGHAFRSIVCETSTILSGLWLPIPNYYSSSRHITVGPSCLLKFHIRTKYGFKWLTQRGVVTTCVVTKLVNH